MSLNNFLRKLIYKKSYIGKVEKDGKVYVKYKKTIRFKFLRESSTIIILIIIIILTLFYSHLINKLLISIKLR